MEFLLLEIRKKCRRHGLVMGFSRSLDGPLVSQNGAKTGGSTPILKQREHFLSH